MYISEISMVQYFNMALNTAAQLISRYSHHSPSPISPVPSFVRLH